MSIPEVITECLTTLEDGTMYTNKARASSLELLKQMFEQSKYVTTETVHRTLAILLHCMKDDLANLPHALAAVSSLFTVSILPPMTVKDYMPSALGLLKLVKTVSIKNGNGTTLIRRMSIDLFLTYPVDVITEIVTTNCSDVLEIIQIYSSIDNVGKKMSKMCHFLLKLLTILPNEQRLHFTKEGADIWFSDLIPSFMNLVKHTDTTQCIYYLKCLEMLTEDLLMVDYSSSPHWKNCLGCICQDKEYPAVIMKMLKSKNDTLWHRIWIVLIKLLKDEITQAYSTFGTPINSMLPVVELAFKLDPQNRCFAFLCWQVLIDSFSREISETALTKRMKLLLIPLRSNNAKTEAVVLVKLNCWWRLISAYDGKMDKYTSEVLLLFITFVFGKNAAGMRPAVSGVAQLFGGQVKDKSIEAFVNIFGHKNCHCNATLPRLKGQLVTSKLLVSNWTEWIFALKVAIKLTALDYKFYNEIEKKDTIPVLCAWKCIMKMLAELPDNGIRRDLFSGLMQELTDLTEISSATENLSEVLIILILNLFEDENAKDLLTNNIEDPPMRKILTMLTNPEINKVFARYPTETVITLFKPVVSMLVNNSKTLMLLDWLMDTIAFKESLILWAALVDSILESEVDVNAETGHKMLVWPVVARQKIQETKYAGMRWYTFYNMRRNILYQKETDTVILNNLNKSVDNKKNARYFKMCVTIALLKNKMTAKEDIVVLARIFKELASAGNSFIGATDPIIPLLIDTNILMISHVIKNESDVELAEVSLKCIMDILKIIGIRGKIDSDLVVFIRNLFDEAKNLFQMPSYTVVSCEFLDDLITYLLKFNKDCQLYLSMLKTIKELITSSTCDQIKSKLNTTIDVLEVIGNVSAENVNVSAENVNVSAENVNVSAENVNFSAENVNKLAQEFSVPEKSKVVKTKKKEANIVSTVVENGEEYVVVKSNWKFNPKNLTENQKEKLQRKREDIPALYQDLSQSQDEFKLASWKTDSQDTTSTNSKSSKSTNDVSTTLKNISSSEVIPKIIDNILSKEDKDSGEKIKSTNVKSVFDTEKAKVISKSPKNPKSPRIALKDRVFRNVRNLLENSKGKSDLKNDDESQINSVSIVDIHNTPKKNDKNLVNPEPHISSADRPSRTRKIPKKFDDVQLFGYTKRRNSVHVLQSDSSNEGKNDGAIDNDNNKKEKDVIDNNVNQEIMNPIIEQNMVTDDMSKTDINQEAVVFDTNVDVVNKPDDYESEQLNVPSLEDASKAIDNAAVAKVADIVIQNVISLASSDNTQLENNAQCDSTIDTTENIPKPVETPHKDDTEVTQQNSTVKKRGRKKSLMSELAIDMVEGHPFLQIQSPKRLTRRKLQSDLNKGNSTPDKVKKSKLTPKLNKKLKEKENQNDNKESESPITVDNSPDKKSPKSDSQYDEPPCSEDVIESSQDSTLTTISVKSTKRTPKRLKVDFIKLDKSKLNSTRGSTLNSTQDLLQNSDCVILSQNQSEVQQSKDDIELPLNKTAEVDKNQSELTENMDTEPISDKTLSEDVIVINDELTPITINTETSVGPETQELAEADTQPNNADFEEQLLTETSPKKTDTNSAAVSSDKECLETPEEITQMDTEPTDESPKKEADVLASFNDEAKRKQDFLNNTSEISPIKIQSPDREKVPPEETTNDYVVVKLAAPVESNGEPFDKSSSPEFFTEDKISPEKRDQSPPRSEVVVNNTSPTSVLSLKKNRPQVRPGGRAAHMLGLCVPNSLNTMKNLERTEPEEAKKSATTTSTPARRNLRLLYNSTTESTDNAAETEDNENFLNFTKSLPSSDSSPAVPILKRKLADILDEATASPANKRKRVSFHDPPVSTTVSVQKYIEPGVMRSPGTSQKRTERPITRTYSKSPKRLEFVKLNTALSKAVDSFTEEQLLSLTNDTLDVTPAVEVVKTSELNDTDPICPELVDCKDPIEKIAMELSSPAMKDLFVKELEGKVGTIGELAKMTELEVNRLCIKAPKVQVAKKVLNNYVNKPTVQEHSNRSDNRPEIDVSISETALIKEMDEEMTEAETKTCLVETQTEKLTACDIEIQTESKTIKEALVQTTTVSMATTSVQTKESGFISTNDVITSCLSERKDFVDRLSERLDEESLRKLADKLPTNAVMDMLASRHKNPSEKHKELAFINDYLCDKYDDRSLMMFCSQLLQNKLDKPA